MIREAADEKHFILFSNMDEAMNEKDYIKCLYIFSPTIIVFNSRVSERDNKVGLHISPRKG